MKIQNYLMKDKSSIKMERLFSRQKLIVAQGHSSMTFLDDEYFELDPNFNQKRQFYKDGKEKNSFNKKSYPVDIEAQRIDWIIKDEDKYGLRYLQEIYNCKNLDIFEQRSITMLIEFLYSRFRLMILFLYLPLNLI